MVVSVMQLYKQRQTKNAKHMHRASKLIALPSVHCHLIDYELTIIPVLLKYL